MVLMMNEEKVLVDKILGGDKEKFAEIVDRYEALVNRIVYNLLFDTEMTRDMTQEIFIKVYQKLPSYKSEYSFKSWITMIARNHAIDHLRREKDRHEQSIDTTEEWDAQSSDCVEESVAAKLAFERGMKLLNDDERTIIILKYKEGFSNGDISRIMNTDEKNINVRIFRAKEKLKAVLAMNG